MAGQEVRAALYCRLSVDDGTDAESSSIANQRELLVDYAAREGWTVAGLFIDDGYSGVNFDRPGFQRMIAEIEAGRVNLVITKDLSRLGRNYIICGQYTELYFPSKGVRYVALSDGYDSQKADNGVAPFKNILNDMYAQDISKKVRTSIRTRAQRGDYLGHTDPYGYLRDPENKRHLVVNPETAPVVRRMFALCASGMGCQETANLLNREGVPCPADYQRLRQGQAAQSGWDKSRVRRIVTNELYLGHMVQGKRRIESYRTKRVIYAAPEEWTRAEHTHEALVSQTEFDRAREAIDRRTRKRKETPEPHLFGGLFYCGDCGRRMSFSNKEGRPASYLCGGYREHGFSACSSHAIRYDALCELVRQELRELVNIRPEEWDAAAAQLADSLGRERRQESVRAEKELEAARRRHRDLVRKARNLYEDKVSGTLPPELFAVFLADYEEERLTVEQRIAAAQASLAEGQNSVLPRPELEKMLKEEMNADFRALLFALIERITITEAHSSDRRREKVVTITYRFRQENVAQ